MSLSATLTKTDKDILDILQSDFPLESQPYKCVAKQLSLTEEEVLSRVNTMREKKIIRRIGPVFDPKSLGYVGALFAAKIKSSEEEKAAAYISTFDGVTHNYHRDDEFNIWFTLVSKNSEEMDNIIKKIEKETKSENILKFESKKVYKIKGVFDVKQ